MDTRKDKQIMPMEPATNGITPRLPMPPLFMSRLFMSRVFDRFRKGTLGNVLGRIHRSPRPQPRLALLERVTLAPRQTLALVEAEGRKFLVATSTDGGSAFYSLDRGPGSVQQRAARVSW